MCNKNEHIQQKCCLFVNHCLQFLELYHNRTNYSISVFYVYFNLVKLHWNYCRELKIVKITEISNKLMTLAFDTDKKLP